jgi:hypothetical protein
VYDIQADENIRLIHDSLADAVEDCIDAAGQEYDIAQQRTLLRAAAYGRAFCRFSLFVSDLECPIRMWICISISIFCTSNQMWRGAVGMQALHGGNSMIE